MAGGIRTLHNKPVAALGQANAADIERILVDLCQRAGVSWAPPSAREVTRSIGLHDWVPLQAASRAYESGGFKPCTS